MEEIASSLGSDRRRVYDIVNVFEALKILHKGKRKQYRWEGMGHLQDFLPSLKQLAEEEKEEWAAGPPPQQFILFVQRFIGLCMYNELTYLEPAAAVNITS